MINKLPQISVVMPLYNSARFIRESIESILNQTFADFELVIVDDGSSDGSSEIIADYAKHDKRIHVYTNLKNQGIVYSLNRGLSCARGRYIARMDADDISFSNRLQTQYDFLEKNLDVGILGSAIIKITPDRERIGEYKFPLNLLDIEWICLLSSPFAHPTVMMRKADIDQHKLRYRKEAQGFEDFDLFSRLLDYTKGVNLYNPLLFYRIHPDSISSRNKSIGNHEYTKICNAQIKKYTALHNVEEKCIRNLLEVFHGKKTERVVAGNTYLDLWSAFRETHVRKNNKNEISRLEREIYITVIKLISFPLFQKDSLKSIIRVFLQDPLIGLKLITSIPSLYTRRVQSLKQKRIRKNYD